MEAKCNKITGASTKLLVSRAEEHSLLIDVDRSDIVLELKISNGAVVEKINRTFNTTDITELKKLIA